LPLRLGQEIQALPRPGVTWTAGRKQVVHYSILSL
jgi:hypothetical protein